MSRRINRLIAEVRKPSHASVIDPLIGDIDPQLRADLEDVGSLVPAPCRVNGEEYADDFWREERRARTMTRLRRHGKLTAAILFTFAMLPLLPTAETSDAGGAVLTVVSPDETRLVQTCLNRFGYAVVIDSIYGPQTTRAVVHFQGSSGLVPDGVAGPKTMAALDAAGCSFRPYVAPPAPPAGGGGGGAGGRCSQWHDLAIAAGFTESQWLRVDPIMWRESRCMPGARNPSGASGLMQIMPMWAPSCGVTRDALFNGTVNLRCAVHILAVQGWSAWAL